MYSVHVLKCIMHSTCIYIYIMMYTLLCLFFISVNTQEKPPRVFISRLKQEELRKEKQGDKHQYRRVKKWELMELRIVDGRSQDAEVGVWSTSNCKWVWLIDYGFASFADLLVIV